MRGAGRARFITPPLNSTAVGRRGAASGDGDEADEVARDRRRRRRTAGRARAGRRARLARAFVAERAVGEEAVDEHALDVAARELGAQRAADHLAAAAEHDHRRRVAVAAPASSCLLGRAARVHQRRALPVVELRAPRPRGARARCAPARDPCCRRRAGCGRRPRRARAPGCRPLRRRRSARSRWCRRRRRTPARRRRRASCVAPAVAGCAPSQE